MDTVGRAVHTNDPVMHVQVKSPFDSGSREHVSSLVGVLVVAVFLVFTTLSTIPTLAVLFHCQRITLI